MMQTIRQRTKIKNGKITIDVPPEFDADEVEVIVLPVKKKPNKEQLLELLLNAPTLTEDEIAEIENVRKWLNDWKIPEF